MVEVVAELGAHACRQAPTKLSIAAGSTNELDYQLLLARDLGFLPEDTHRILSEQVAEVRRMLF